LSCLELLPIKDLKVQVKNKSPTEFRPPKPLLIATYSR
jgi:hypothetical protein